eukprot:6186151-Pleurochrysis_carterae.AAC.1
MSPDKTGVLQDKARANKWGLQDDPSRCTRCEDGGSRTCISCLDMASKALTTAVELGKHQILRHPIWDDVFSMAWRSPMISKCLETVGWRRGLLVLESESGLPATSEAYQEAVADVEVPEVMAVDVRRMLEDGSDAVDTRFTIEIIRAYALCTADEARSWFKCATYRRSEHGFVNIYHAPATGADARIILEMGPRGGVDHSVGECLSMVMFDELRQCEHDGCNVLALGEKLRVAGQ